MITVVVLPSSDLEQTVVPGTRSLGKKVVFVLVGVEVSSLSEMHRGLDEPEREGPGEAIEEYPELLRLDSDVVLLAHVVMMVKGLK